MRNVWKKIQEKGGFISVEVMVVAMILIGLGVFAILAFSDASVEAVHGTMDKGIFEFYFLLDQLQHDGVVGGEVGNH